MPELADMAAGLGIDDIPIRKMSKLDIMTSSAVEPARLTIESLAAKIKAGASIDLAGKPHDTGDDVVEVAIEDDALLPARALAARFDVPLNALRQRLDRFRKKQDHGWMENADPKVREDKYLFHLKAVRPIIDELKRKTSG